MAGRLSHQTFPPAFVVVAWLISILAPACREEEPPVGPAPAPGQASPAESVADRIERIRTLGYAGYTEEKADPARSGVVVHDPARSCPGYSLYTVFRQAAAYLIEPDGQVLHSWEDPDGYHWGRCDLLPNGDLLVVGSSTIEKSQKGIRDESRYVARLSWNGELVWRRSLPVHHDVEVTPQNQIAVLGFRYRDVPAWHAEIPLRDEEIMILSMEGQVLKRYSLYDILKDDSEVYTLKEGKTRRRRRKPEIQLFHANTLEQMRRPHLEARDPIYASGNMLVSLRHQDAVMIVNLESMKVVWAWGHGELLGPHSGTVLENGNILVFDNGLGRDWSRVIELDPLAKNIVWEYRAAEPKDFYSATRGSCQRLENGNTLITNSDHGQAFEVTPDGETVWEYFVPHLNDEGHRATIVRTHRYPEQFVRNILEQFADSGPGLERRIGPEAPPSDPAAQRR